MTIESMFVRREISPNVLTVN
jgi:hypothetical protein